MKRFSALILGLAGLLVLQSVAWASGFGDIQGHWAADTITKLNAMDVVRGDGEGRARPDDPITRVEFVALLLRAEDVDLSAEAGQGGAGQGKADFQDVAIDAWFYPYVRAARAQGIVNGLDQSHFGPEAYITREQIVAMIVRAAQAVQPVNSENKTFVDVEAGRWSEKYILAAYQAGVVNGVEPNAFKPADRATRAQAMAMIQRVLLAETKPEFLPSDGDLIKLVEDQQQSLAGVITAGYPYDWSRINSYLIGAAREDFAGQQRLYDLLGAAGVKYSSAQLTQNSRVMARARNLATVESEVRFKATETKPGANPSDIEQVQKNLYYLRRVGGTWKLYNVEPVKN